MPSAYAETVAPVERPAAWLGLGSMLGIAGFALAVGALHLLNPAFKPATRFISEYANGPYGYLLSLAFWGLGLGSLLLAIALWRVPLAGL